MRALFSIPNYLSHFWSNSSCFHSTLFHLSRFWYTVPLSSNARYPKSCIGTSLCSGKYVYSCNEFASKKPLQDWVRMLNTIRGNSTAAVQKFRPWTGANNLSMHLFASLICPATNMLEILVKFSIKWCGSTTRAFGSMHERKVHLKVQYAHHSSPSWCETSEFITYSNKGGTCSSDWSEAIR